MQKEISLKKKVQNSALFRKLALICPCPLTSSFQFLTSNFHLLTSNIYPYLYFASLMSLSMLR